MLQNSVTPQLAKFLFFLSHLSYFVQRSSGAAIHIAVGSQTHGPQLSRYEDMRRCVDGGLKAVLRRFKGGGSHNVADDL